MVISITGDNGSGNREVWHILHIRGRRTGRGRLGSTGLIHAFTKSVIQGLKQFAFPVTRLLFVHIRLVEGVLKETGLPFRMLIAGEGWVVSNTLAAFREGSLSEVYRRRVPVVWALYLLHWRRTEFDLLLGLLPDFYRPLWRRWADYQGLCSLRWTMDTSQGLAATMAAMNEGNRSAMRKIGADSSLRFCSSRSESDLEFFYREMYLPLMQQRHGEQALLSSYATQLAIFQEGELAFLEKSGVRIAAVLFSVEDTSLVFQDFGVLAGDLQLRKDGAIAALYYFGLRLAVERGLSALDCKFTTCWLANGLVQHKASLGGKVTYQTWLGHLCVRFGRNDDKARAFFASNPLAIDVGGQLQVLTAAGANDETAIARKVSRWKKWGFENVELLPARPQLPQKTGH